MKIGAQPPGYPIKSRYGVHEMEWLNAVLPINGNSSYIVKMLQGSGQMVTHWWSWITIPFVAVCVHITDAFGVVWWIIFWLWALDMLMGNSRAFLSTKIQWNISKNLDGVLKLITYGIIGVTLHLVEILFLEAWGVDMSGVFLGGGYTICAMNEVKSLFKHFVAIIPGFKVLGDRILKAVDSLSEPGDPPTS